MTSHYRPLLPRPGPEIFEMNNDCAQTPVFRKTLTGEILIWLEMAATDASQVYPTPPLDEIPDALPDIETDATSTFTELATPPLYEIPPVLAIDTPQDLATQPLYELPPLPAIDTSEELATQPLDKILDALPNINTNATDTFTELASQPLYELPPLLAIDKSEAFATQPLYGIPPVLATDTSQDPATQPLDEIPPVPCYPKKPILHGPKGLHSWEAFIRRELGGMHLEPLVDCTDEELADLAARCPEEHALNEDIAFLIVARRLGTGIRRRLKNERDYPINHDGSRSPHQTVKELWTHVFALCCPSRDEMWEELRTMTLDRTLHDYINRALWLRRQLLRLGE
ncbi:uncharacterized protein B0T15DRAFT_562518 [Chaetomium strumarium]|uniref:Uncharacterized protein n=1 Tax=Chaetomium strumarium TaxID=1170767 RepID=A0AAJ0GMS5_9PEZI|nr:hypothetical protein B0T15DRAFT_562518 [Chaetomium strumarium]